MDVFEKITAQQKGIENTAPWMVGEQLKDICRREPECAELVEKDLDVKGMSLADCEKKIKAYADSHKKDKFACVPPNVAEEIIRKFYGLPGMAKGKEEPSEVSPQSGGYIDLASFI